ncbi:MAG: hypothetical protein M3237_11250 [Actinomycetota bacterium]|nr:hypothetical protein [Actinomycetota bacterium]
MDLTRTRLTLHGVAELLLAGPQYARSRTVRLRVVPGGIATVAEPDLRIEGTELVSAQGRQPLRGSYAEIAAAAGLTPRRLDDVYRDSVNVSAEDPIELDPDHVAMLLDGFAAGDAALRAFAPDEVPVLWPEHFDVGISQAEVNYGYSPGDVTLSEPYVYVGPWVGRSGPFWNQPFGAARPLAAFGGLDSVVAFFREGAERAAADPVHG